MEKSACLDSVKVDIPIACSIKNDKKDKIISNHCRLESMSLESMSISLPLSPDLFEENIIDFDLNLPEPFMRIRGQGQIQWKQWNAENQQTRCNLKLEQLTLQQLVDYDILINELSKSSHHALKENKYV